MPNQLSQLFFRSFFPVGLHCLLILCIPSGVYAQFFEPNRPNRELTPADSLAAFRPDTLDAGLIDRLENGRTGKDSLQGKKDSLKQVSSLRQFDDRHAYFALHAGVGFQDLTGASFLEADLNAKVTATRGRLLQPYEPVHLYFPVGIELGLPLFAYFDGIVKSHSFWYRQNGLYRDSLAQKNQERFFVVQGHLAGLGGKLYIPKEMLSAKNRGLIYVQIMRYWDVAGNELYSSRGSVQADWAATGSATEIQLGFSQVLDAKWTWSAALTYFRSNWKSSDSWGQVLDIPETNQAHWGGNALQLRFYLFWNPNPLLKPDSGKPAKP